MPCYFLLERKMTCSHVIGSKFIDKVFEVIKSGLSSSGTTEDTHEISDINSLETTLSSSLSSIQELILKIAGVQSALDKKADKEHTHEISDITDLTISESIYGDDGLYTGTLIGGTDYFTILVGKVNENYSIRFAINDNFEADKFSQFTVTCGDFSYTFSYSDGFNLVSGSGVYYTSTNYFSFTSAITSYDITITDSSDKTESETVRSVISLLVCVCFVLALLSRVSSKSTISDITCI